MSLLIEVSDVSHWKRFFDGYADRYDNEIFTKNTEAEITFLVDRLRLAAGARILDIGCGTGRHTVGLAARGYAMTGVDLSDGMLDQARARAKKAGVEVEWIQANAAEFARPDAFDAAVSLCEGGICLYDIDHLLPDQDVRIISNIYASLKAGAPFILNVLNACRQIRRFTDADVEAGRFDPVTLTEVSELPPDAVEPGMVDKLRERGYTGPELRRVLLQVGFEIEGIHGGTAGDWGLRPPKLDEYELMALARKPTSS